MCIRDSPDSLFLHMKEAVNERHLDVGEQAVHAGLPKLFRQRTGRFVRHIAHEAVSYTHLYPRRSNLWKGR